ncbi:MAG: hypothetical protein A2268_16875 [Candidatus Raymondbacteria bacterium RifOxyA12_full_50_37]|uniref:Uncharacterized protein n=1 Tax=Candidatus Raymondbacteria bacterium RIFOXYD12_FULL_49_13 TaxID=1817890 RepID=A0A1F7FCI1_UNCRA|nr:MAG: hypothetical protein A2268_16875 [Candidatus Raymondbacteria bacterium RifOxyA12_full_50_37]OGJ86284.1 MAG: hypothetical protein A2248_16470 [Candidatus Raymondbacteria bacterium RIFOXYA2_FULL_49_16]OGJ93612.1 MAG: hypothetical protein A2487_20140 [Candidatus Raymondbacteria bacterium RifOxyC12_full_50_8]OGJ95821.1 MAG: hypothetical protein A2453_11785 [Candidatus Raymondbacteria bacterium RIFOXYC2_FULL_50_21]OGJ99049.1 MAG: hypothetical protein A2350_17295 [Candidatus Raymondbacteria b
MKFQALIVVFIFIGLGPVFSQIDLKEKAQLIGIQPDERKGATEQEHQTDIAFIFMSQPSAYYHQRKENTIIIEFYDAMLGEDPLSPIAVPPFASSKVSNEKVDVNAGIEGLQADLKDIVRVELTFDEGVELDLTLNQDFNVITLATVWSRGGKLKSAVTTRKSKTWIWMIGGFVGITGAAVGVLYSTGVIGGKEDTVVTNNGWKPPPLPGIPTPP